MRRISHSEVNSFLHCEYKHFVQFEDKLEPKTFSTSLSRGIWVHAILEVYYNAVKVGATGVEAETAAKEYLYSTTTPNNLEMAPAVLDLMERYFAYAANDDWTILAVEQHVSLLLDEDISYDGKIDLLVKINSGQRAGQIVVIDHKTVWDFYTTDDLLVNAQIPKYIAALRAMDINASWGMVNQLRHRTKQSYQPDSEKFRRDFIKPGLTEIKAIMTEHYEASKRIVNASATGAMPLRTMDKFTCKNCGVLPLCRSELLGENTDLMRTTLYQPNSYGYGDSNE